MHNSVLVDVFIGELRKSVVIYPFALPSGVVQYCTDPGVAEHGRRIISDSRFLVGATVQYACDRGYLMEGASLLT